MQLTRGINFMTNIDHQAKEELLMAKKKLGTETFNEHFAKYSEFLA